MPSRRPGVLVAGLAAILSVACAQEPVPLPDDDRVADWWLAGQPTNGTIELQVFAGSDGCDAYRGVDVTEFEDEVRVRARVDAIGGPDCEGEPVVEQVTVPLAGDLADRALTGCAAPEGGLRAPDLDDHDDSFDCRDRSPPRVGADSAAGSTAD